MHPRDLPEVVSELIIEVRSELSALNGRGDRLEQAMIQVEQQQRGLREEVRALEPFLNRLLEHDDQLRCHQGRLNNLENPSA